MSRVSKQNYVGPGGLHTPPLVADESEAGHCFLQLFPPSFFFFLFMFNNI